MTTLEILTTARESVATGRFRFEGWTTCTCGHIYRAAKGQPASLTGITSPMTSDYAAALEAVVAASPEIRGLIEDVPTPRYCDPIVRLVSNMTEAIARRAGVKEREAALELLDRAIARETELDEAARVAVLAEAEAVVEAAAPEAVPA